MSDFIKNLGRNPIVRAANGRDRDEFFGQGWSHYPKCFESTKYGIRYYLSVYNTPNHLRVNWSLYDEAMPLNGSGCAEWPWGETWLLFELTPEESREFAAMVGLEISEWLAAAIEACRTDVTPQAMANLGNVVDLDTFHAARIGGDDIKPDPSPSARGASSSPAT